MRRPAQRVLQEADHCAGETPANRVAPRHRKKDHDHHWQIDDGQPAHLRWQKRLDKKGNQRDQNDSEPTELIDRHLLSGGIASAKWHGSSAHWGGVSAALGGVAGCFGLESGWTSAGGWRTGFGVVAPSPVPLAGLGF